MKRFLFVLAILAIALPVSAAEVCIDAICYTSQADENTSQAFFKALHNEALCEGVGLAETCTQAEYDAVDLDAEQDGQQAPPAAVIYSNDANGTRTFFLDRIKEHLRAQVDYYENSFDQRARDAWEAANLAQREAACTALGKDTDCTEL